MAKKANVIKRGIRHARVDESGIMRAYFAEFEREKLHLGLVPDTVRAYRKTFEKFEEHFGERMELAGDIIPSLFTEWAAAMKDEGLAAASINHNLSGIRVFMYWCMELEREYLPYFKIRLVKRQQEIPKAYEKSLTDFAKQFSP